MARTKPFFDPNAMPQTVSTWERYKLVTRWGMVDGRLEPVELTISDSAYPTTPSAITAEVLRRLPLGRLLRKERELMATIAERTGSVAASRALSARRGVAVGDDALSAVAEVYRKAHHDGFEPPRRAVATAFGIAESTAAKRIMAARRAGLLGPARAGKAGEA